MQEPSEKDPLPAYDRPPVVETILGVQFERLPRFKMAHLGGFWKTLDTHDWPTVSDAPPLEPQFERFADFAKWTTQGIQLRLTKDLSPRLQIRNSDGDRMIQVQNGRVHFNWLGQAQGQYPHYEEVRKGFLWTLDRFTQFLAQEDLGKLQPNQWEVTYVNHIPKGTVWDEPDDWEFFRPLGLVPTIDGVIRGESFTGGWHFVIPGQRGRLHVEWQHAVIPESEQQETVVLTLTARGPLQQTEEDLQPVVAGLDLGRETIVRAFKGFMNNAANRYWGLKYASNES